MAKVGAPLPRGDLEPLLRDLLIEKTAGKSRTINRYVTDYSKSELIGAAQWPRLMAYAEQWYYMTPWKKLRWQVCALRGGDHTAATLYGRGRTGLNLFIACAVAQKTAPPALPISPCARRRWDGAASPHDYTP